MRLALLCPGKHCALVNNFGDSEDTVARLEELGCVNIGKEFLKEQQRIEPYIDEGGSKLRERVLWELLEHLVEANVQRLFNLVALDVASKLVSYEGMVYHR